MIHWVITIFYSIIGAIMMNIIYIYSWLECTYTKLILDYYPKDTRSRVKYIKDGCVVNTEIYDRNKHNMAIMHDFRILTEITNNKETNKILHTGEYAFKRGTTFEQMVPVDVRNHFMSIEITLIPEGSTYPVTIGAPHNNYYTNSELLTKPHIQYLMKTQHDKLIYDCCYTVNILTDDFDSIKFDDNQYIYYDTPTHYSLQLSSINEEVSNCDE